MRILHQLNGLSMGGVETFVYRLCKYATEETYIFSHSGGTASKLFSGINTKIFEGNTFEDISNVISSNDINIVVFHTGGSLPTYAKQLKDRFPTVKFIAVVHCVWKLQEEWLDKIICISSAVKKENDPSKSVLIYPGVEYGGFNIGNVSRLAPYKFTQDLIFIVSELLKEINDVHLWVVGDEAIDSVGFKNQITQMSKDLEAWENIHLVGYQEEIPWEIFDIYVHPVGDEAYPVTILEALSRNIPTYTYEKRGTGEMWHPLLTKSHDVMELGNAIYNYIKARPKHCKNVAKEFSQVYRELIPNEDTVRVL